MRHERVTEISLIQLGNNGIEGGGRVGGLRDGAADDDAMHRWRTPSAGVATRLVAKGGAGRDARPA